MGSVIETVLGCFKVIVTLISYLSILVGINILAIDSAWFKKWGWRLLIFGNVIGLVWLLVIGEYLAAVLTTVVAISCFVHYRIQRRSER